MAELYGAIGDIVVQLVDDIVNTTANDIFSNCNNQVVQDSCDHLGEEVGHPVHQRVSGEFQADFSEMHMNPLIIPIFMYHYTLKISKIFSILY